MNCLDGRRPGQIGHARGLPMRPITIFSLSTPRRLILALGRDAMPDSDQQLEIEAPEELLADMPLPSDAKTFFLGGIFVLSMLTAAYVASEIVLPLIFAIMLNLLMQPALRALEGLRVPRALAALLLILFVFATIVGLGAAVAGPAEAWMRRLVEVLPRFASKRQAVDISQQIGRDISAYLLTITLMNALVGAATALVMWSTGVGDPVLWVRSHSFSIMCRLSDRSQLFLSSYSPAPSPSLRLGQPCCQRRSMAPSMLSRARR